MMHSTPRDTSRVRVGPRRAIVLTQSSRAPRSDVTLESLASGRDKELSRVEAGLQRAIIFARLENREFGVVSVALRDGAIERVLGVTRLQDHEISELDNAVVAARLAWRGEP